VPESAIIALAVCPSTPEALPLLEEAFAGAGRPSGIATCERRDPEIVITWDLRTTSASVVLALVDTELARLRASRTCRIVSPLTIEWLARIAAEGLGAKELVSDRILDVRLEQSGVVD
jgi:hypothetical protein